jgi:hypothetical protein
MTITQKIQKHCHSENYWTRKRESHPSLGIPGNKIADEEAKVALKDYLSSTEKYPLQDLINWIKTEYKKTRKTR